MKKLYAVVRDDLSPAQRAVQAGHAVAEFLLTKETEWDNGTLVYLRVPDLWTLEKLSEELKIDHARFVEPDVGDQLTAIAAVSEGQHFKHLKLMK